MSTPSNSDSAQFRCLKQNLSCSVVQMISGNEACHGQGPPFRWEQMGESCSHGGHIGAHMTISWDCCVVVGVNLVGARSVG